nr:MAG TPA: hypothetical protein [Caudoviricetes sp.]
MILYSIFSTIDVIINLQCYESGTIKIKYQNIIKRGFPRFICKE